MKKYFWVCMVLAIILFSLPAAHAGKFSDISESHWAYEAVEQLAEKGIITGLPDGTFRGRRSVSRYVAAAAIFRAINSLGTGAAPVADADVKSLISLANEFSGELESLGLSIAEVGNELKAVRRIINEDLQIIHTPTGGARRAKEKVKVKISGDSWIHYDDTKYANDTVEDNANTFYRIGLNIEAVVGEVARCFIRVSNGDIAGGKFDSLQGITFNVELGFVEVDNLFDVADTRIGRQFVKLGYGVTLDDKLDALVLSAPLGLVDMTLLAADEVDNGVNESGFSLTGLDFEYKLSAHQLEFYYLLTDNDNGIKTTNLGIALDGPIMEQILWLKDIDYLVEYSQYNSDTAGGKKGSAFLVSTSWRASRDSTFRVVFGRGDEEYEPIGIYYWRRPFDIFGNMSIGTLPPGSTLATGSLKGVEDGLVRLDTRLSDRLSSFVIHEKVSVHDNSVLTNAYDYKRDTIGFDCRYKPNTTLGFRWDKVKFDRPTTNLIQNTGGWTRYRIEITVKF